MKWFSKIVILNEEIDCFFIKTIAIKCLIAFEIIENY